MLLAAFAPITGANGLVATANLAATASAQTLTLAAIGAARAGCNQVRIENHATDWAYLNFGTVTQVTGTPATVAASLGVAPGAVEILTIDPTVTTASIILGSGTGTVRITNGEGV